MEKLIVDNITKEKLEKIIHKQIEWSFEFQDFWIGKRCEVTENEKEYDCSFYGESTWSNKSGFLGSVNFLKRKNV